ncbi:MAG: hypothetical protein RL382_321 [Actinomycetota bacterium]|jgi:hypothetical protein
MENYRKLLFHQLSDLLRFVALMLHSIYAIFYESQT